MRTFTLEELRRARDDRQGRQPQFAGREVPTGGPDFDAGPPPRKENRPCCMALVDDLGRPPLGFCSAECIGRPANWALVRRGEAIPKGGALDWRPPGEPERKTPKRAAS